MEILELQNLKKEFNLGEGRTLKVLKGIDLKIKKGEFVAIKGSSGSGKSTLLNVMAGLDKPSTGKVILDKEEISHYSENDLSDIRNKKIGFVFQSFHLVPSLTASENISFPVELAKRSNVEKKVHDLLSKVNLEHRKNSFPNQLSGGEKQRVAIARALINEPVVIFADEPTGNLDSKNSKEVMKLLLDLKDEFGMTLIIVTHEENVADMAERVITIEDGLVVKDKRDKKNK